MNLNNQDLASFPAPPSVIKTLIKGFNVVTSHIYLILLPVLLDLVLWLGPQLKIDAILESFFTFIKESAQNVPADLLTTLSEIQTNFNLLTVLRTYPVGVFSLFSNPTSNETPMGVKTAIDLISTDNTVLLILALNVIGIFFGILYFRTVAHASIPSQNTTSLPRQILNVFLLNLAWSVASFFVMIAVSIVLFLLSLLGDPLRTIFGLILTVPLAWLLLFAFYSFFPLFSGASNILEALKRGWRTIRYGIPTLGWFSMVVLVISNAMDFLWQSAPPSSWMAAFGIFGHGFVSTGLLVASFIYYVETNSWIEQTALWFKSKNETNSGK